MSRTPTKGLKFAVLVAVLMGGGAVAASGIFPAGWWKTVAPAPATAASPNEDKPAGDGVRVTDEQINHLERVKVGVCDFQPLKTAIGQIAFNEDARVNIFTPFSGRVTRLLARTGDEVKRGDPLFEIDSPEVVQSQTDLIAAVHAREKARSHLDTAKRQSERQQYLLREKSTSQRDADNALHELTSAESDFKTAEGALNAARHRLRVIIGRDEKEVERVERERMVNPLLIVSAPIDGTVVARRIGPGQFVKTDATEAHFSIADLSTMWLKAFVSEADIPFVRVGQEIEVKVLAIPNGRTRARIDAIGAASDPATRRIMVRSEIPNPDRLLRAEMFATFRIAVGERETATAVPTVAVIREGNEARLWVETEPHIFQRRAVKLGAEQGGCVQISDGLSQGETVVATGAIFVDNATRR